MCCRSTPQESSTPGGERRNLRTWCTLGQALRLTPYMDGVRFHRMTDWLAEDARRNAEFGVEQPAKGTLGYRLRQVRTQKNDPGPAMTRSVYMRVGRSYSSWRKKGV